jgi:transposase
VAEFFDLDWDAVKAIDKRHLAKTLGPIDVGDVRIIGMDEFVIHKGHGRNRGWSRSGSMMRGLC